MFGSVVLDVAIGMAFVYLLLSLVASVVQEMIAAFLQLRPTNLLRGVRSLFSGDSLWGRDLVDALYNHGLVRGLFSDPGEDLKGVHAGEQAQERAAPEAAAKPQSREQRMVTALRHALQSWVRLKAERGVNGVAEQSLLPAYIPSRTFALAIIDILNTHNKAGDDAMKAITQSLADHNWIYRENKAVQAMYALALNAKGDLKAFQTNLENWYNDSMDRASGWYKRYVQRILLYLGLALAVCFNVNTVSVARTLWFDRDSRQAMVNAAEEYEKHHPDPAPQAGAAPQPDKAASSPEALRKKLEEAAGAFNTATRSALLPVGWKETPLAYARSAAAYLEGSHTDKWATVFETMWRCLVFLTGWAITGVAISLGAPFWFDTLNKFMVVRSTIKPQEKSQPEASKD